MSHRMLNNQFYANVGKDVSSLEKPFGTDKHKNTRIVWVKINCKMTNPYEYIAYMDTQLFYTTSCGRKIKLLPMGANEEDSTHTYKQSKVMSHYFPVKYVFPGVVG